RYVLRRLVARWFLCHSSGRKTRGQGGADQPGDRSARRAARLPRPAEESAHRRALRAHRGAPARVAGAPLRARHHPPPPPACGSGGWVLLVETGDEVLDYRRAVARYAGAEQVVVQGGDHSLQCFPEMLPRILKFAAL